MHSKDLEDGFDAMVNEITGIDHDDLRGDQSNSYNELSIPERGIDFASSGGPAVDSDKEYTQDEFESMILDKVVSNGRNLPDMGGRQQFQRI